MSRHRLDLSPSTDYLSAYQLLSDSDAILSRHLYTGLRSRGYTAAESLLIVHHHNEYDYRPPQVPLSQRFTKRKDK